MQLSFDIPQLNEADIECSEHRCMLPDVNQALRNYVVNRVCAALVVAPSKIEPKLKTLANGGAVKTTDPYLRKAIDLELERAYAQIPSKDSRCVAAQAAVNVRRRIEFNKRRRGKSTHSGNQDLVRLLGSFNSIWLTHRSEIPGAVNNDGAVSGTYLEFVREVLQAFAGKIPDAVIKIAPSLKAEINAKVVSCDALHATFRKTNISKLRTIR